MSQKRQNTSHANIVSPFSTSKLFFPLPQTSPTISINPTPNGKHSSCYLYYPSPTITINPPNANLILLLAIYHSPLLFP